MINVKEDLTNKVFGRLTVIKQVEDYVTPKGKHHARWLCECSCKERNQVIVVGDKLKNLTTQSCGCLRKERCAKIGTNKKGNTAFNEYKFYETYGVGITSNTNKEFYFDIEDYDVIKNYYWCEKINTNGYHTLCAWDSENEKQILMHWLIIGKGCDHIDRNPLNNRKENLRKVTFQDNSHNRSKPKNNTSSIIGVSWDKKRELWRVDLTLDYKRIYLGSYANKIDAIKKRLQAEIKYFGVEFAPQRHLFEEYEINI